MDAVNHVEHGNQVDQPLPVRLIACPHLAMEHGRIDRYVPAGPTVAAHLRAIGWKLEGLHARVFIDGEFIEHAQWEYAVPRRGQSCVARVIPMSKKGGGKGIMGIVAMIGIVVASIFTAGGGLAGLAGMIGGSGAWAGAAGLGLAGGLGASLAAAAVTVAGSLQMNAVLRRNQLTQEGQDHARLTIHDAPSDPRRRTAARDGRWDFGRAGRARRRGRLSPRTTGARRVDGARH